MDTRHLIDPELLPLVEKYANFALNEKTLGGLRQAISDASASSNCSNEGLSITVDRRSVPRLDGAGYVPIVVVAPAATRPGRGAVLHLHGGGFVTAVPSRIFHACVSKSRNSTVSLCPWTILLPRRQSFLQLWRLPTQCFAGWLARLIRWESIFSELGLPARARVADWQLLWLCLRVIVRDLTLRSKNDSTQRRMIGLALRPSKIPRQDSLFGLKRATASAGPRSWELHLDRMEFPHMPRPRAL